MEYSECCYNCRYNGDCLYQDCNCVEQCKDYDDICLEDYEDERRDTEDD